MEKRTEYRYYKKFLFRKTQKIYLNKPNNSDNRSQKKWEIFYNEATGKKID
ncbi:MAG: hypothetical protein WA105_01170 [Candidatus Hydromicrobium sp.]